MKGYLTSSQFGALLIVWVAALAITIDGVAKAFPPPIAHAVDQDEHEELGADSYYEIPFSTR